MIGLLWVYGIRSGEYIKIGVSRNIELRLKDFQLGNPHQLTIVMRQISDEAYWLERRMHEILDYCRFKREWFLTNPKTAREALRQSLDDLAEKRRRQIAWEVKTGEWDRYPHPLAAWDGRGIMRPDVLND